MSLRAVIVTSVFALAASGGAAAVISVEPTAAEGGSAKSASASRAEPAVRHEPGEAMLTQRVGSGVPEGAYQRALAQTRQLTDAAPQAAANTARAEFAWKMNGPTNIGGRVVDVALDPDDSSIVYVAAASGGVWKSTNAGRTFQEAWSPTMTQAIGAMAMDSDGVLWVGTGETNPGGGSTTFGGTGLYRSADGGKTWTRAGLADSHRIGRIVIDPNNPDRIFVAVSGDLFTPGGTRGLYRTENGGRTWQEVLDGATATAGAVDIAIDPSNTDRVYATFWDHQRTKDVRRYGGPGSRAYRSTDGGDTWQQMTQGLPEPSETTGRMGIAVAPSDGDRLYVIHINRLGGFAGFFTSNDGGDSWTRTADDALLQQSQSSYGWWFGRVWVTPDDADDVWVAGVPLIRSGDGGDTWTYGAGNNVHVDHHAMVWDPRVEDRIYLGNDGGLYRTDDDGATWTKAEHEPYTQFYTLDVGQQDRSRIVGGAQDNGCNRSYGETQGWNGFSCGDGLETLINPADQRYVYACSQYGFCGRSEDGGDTMRSFYNQTTSDRRNWKTPVEFDPTDPSVMYYAGNILNRSTDGGKTWKAISPDLTSGPSPDPQYPWGTITTVAAAATDPDRLYVGTDDSRVWTSPDGGQSWQRIDQALPERWVTRVRVDPTDADVVYATFSGFRQGDSAAHVFRSDDAGATWQDISGNLPNAPVNDLVVSGQQLYIANDTGVFVSPNSGRSWLAYDQGLPRAPVMELRVHQPSGEIHAATFGRGMYSVALLPGGVE
ncbi:MAG: WD40/YVTN/BNR-like repeat-containing protein [Nocardioidaceae bacterium]